MANHCTERLNLIRQLVVEHEEVRLYMDCGEAERTSFHRRPEKLTFSHNSGIFVSNAGSTGLNRFVVSGEILQIQTFFKLWAVFAKLCILDM